MTAAQKSAVALGDCIVALVNEGDEVDARAGAIVLAEFVNLVRGALRKK